MLDVLGGRKFIFALFLTILTYSLVVMGKLAADAFITFALGIGSVYVIGNVAATVANGMVNTPADPKP